MDTTNLEQLFSTSFIPSARELLARISDVAECPFVDGPPPDLLVSVAERDGNSFYPERKDILDFLDSELVSFGTPDPYWLPFPYGLCAYGLCGPADENRTWMYYDGVISGSGVYPDEGRFFFRMLDCFTSEMQFDDSPIALVSGYDAYEFFSADADSLRSVLSGGLPSERRVYSSRWVGLRCSTRGWSRFAGAKRWDAIKATMSPRDDLLGFVNENTDEINGLLASLESDILNASSSSANARRTSRL